MFAGKMRWWITLTIMSAVVLGLDMMSGPHILFPITFVFPVGLAAWHLKRPAGIVFGLVLGICRLAIALGPESQIMPRGAALANAGIRMVVLVALAVLVEAAQNRRQLAARVQVLEGILPICSHCKRIRRADDSWQEIEAYVSERTEANFSHGFCHDCLGKYYPEYLPERSGPA